MIDIHPTRLQLYIYLVDGKEQGHPLCAASAAREAGITRQSADPHIKALIKDHYIVRSSSGRKREKMFVRGPKAAILDEYIRSIVRSPLDGGRTAQNCCQVDKNPPAPVIAGESHVDGFYSFPVLRVGSVTRPLTVRSGDLDTPVRVFETLPSRFGSVEIYIGRVPLEDGTEVKVNFWNSQKPFMKAFVEPVHIVASTVHQARDLLKDRAVQAATLLSKHLGWQFGEPTFVNMDKDSDGYHFATNDPLVMEHFPEAFQPAKESGYEIDRTPGPRALETKGKAQGEGEAKAVEFLDYLNSARDLRAGQKDLDQRIVELRHQMEGLVSISEMQAVTIANIAAAEAEQIERAARGLGNNIEAEVLGR